MMWAIVAMVLTCIMAMAFDHVVIVKDRPDHSEGFYLIDGEVYTSVLHEERIVTLDGRIVSAREYSAVETLGDFLVNADGSWTIAVR